MLGSPSAVQPPSQVRQELKRRPARWLALSLTAGLLLGGTVANTAPIAPASAAEDTGGLNLSGENSSLLSADTTAIAPGLDLTSFKRLQPQGWVTGHVMVADLDTPTLSMDVLDSGTVSGGATVSAQVEGTGAVAAVNGDYFDMNASGAPVSTNVSSTRGVLNATDSNRPALTMADGVAAIQQIASAATATIDGDTVDIPSVNAPNVPRDAIGYYTPLWGSHPLSRVLGGPAAMTRTFAIATVTDGVVTSVTSDPAAATALVTAATAIPSGSAVLVGREAAAARIAALTVGQAVDVTVGTTADVDLAVSGSQRLLVDGAQTKDDQVEAARTAVGVSKDGTVVYVASIEGRAGDARGMTVQELGRLLLDLGAHNAVNLDGGGSTTLVARAPGTDAPTLVNRPSDGTERVVANSLAFFSSAPAAVLADVAISTASTNDEADAVFPGLSRTVTGTGLDANYAGMDVAGEFAASNDGVTVEQVGDASARVTGVKPGRTEVSFSAEGKTAATELHVLGDLARLQASRTVISLAEPGSSAVLSIAGLDGDGFRAPIETSDLTVTSGSDITVAPSGVDSFLVTPNVESGSATITVEAGGQSVEIAVTIGYRYEPVTDLSDLASWTSAAARATGTTTAATGPNGEPAMKLNYDFTTSTATRGYYAIAPAPITLAGQPQALTMWIHGDGNGAWPRLQVKTGNGVTTNLDGALVGWTGWKEVTFTVPAGTAYPLKLERIRMMETRSAASYHGEVTIAGISTIVAPDVEQPAASVVYDDVIVTDGTVKNRKQRIAVMSDAQFVARNPDSAIVQAARRTLQEIVAEEPDLLVINGDLVDEASVADFDLARTVLDEEVGDTIPWIYVPGNHEVMGGAIANFEAEFGDTTQTKRLGSTLVVTLNSANGSLGRSDSAQLRMLEDALAEAEKDSGITGVIVFAHHPANDPLPSKASQLSDRYEAEELEATLAAFRADSGKSIATVNAHVGVFHATSFDGVSSIINGNSGKGPSGTPETGGFTGWTMLGIDPKAGVVGSTPATVVDRTEWLRAETKPRVDEVRLEAPAVMTVGETLSIDASILQDEGREVPVQWPMSADWSGARVVIDGGREKEGPASVLRFNPATKQLTAVATGTAVLKLTVNGKKVSTEVTVVAAPGGTAAAG
ncbi:phosphodiester glycosidase family protein [Mycetocola sp.]|uniref:phosphodiester glycosidase family protein n=1 Tax=Mycetocola sp. TaxID=1871042 RepID=UPI0039891248